MDVFLMRHGFAEDVGGKIKTDFDRPLTGEGVKLMQAEARGLKRLDIRFNVIMCSPLVRAKQTAEAVAEVLGHKKVVVCDGLAIPASTAELMQAFKPFQMDYSVLLVGHMPDVGRLAGFFTGVPRLAIPFKKGAICKIEVERIHPSPSGEIRWFMTPRQLKFIGES
ncbi:MAG TPA: phosphohistidine phosphatase SixA [bacterium]|nr:phosphohistidine phosphatase SixA [bacterium]HMW34081.1 phosphohistidine phosphatase SixA [bacterium]HMW37019.1 phosphohistidine phosphatase SixA [bacterium]HMY35341.1 phosphohistidine phosphatase SixA [bacterium]HMZ03741.1 phosphohistidine phosphatase SixA [bacterium]